MTMHALALRLELRLPLAERRIALVFDVPLAPLDPGVDKPVEVVL